MRGLIYGISRGNGHRGEGDIVVHPLGCEIEGRVVLPDS
jgi:hypothetical protein